MPLDLENPEDKAALDAAVSKALESALPAKVEEETAALKAKNEELIGEKRGLSEKLREFDGLDIGNVKKMMETLESSEEAKLLAEGKTEEVFARRFEKINLDYSSKITDLSTKLESAERIASEAESRANAKIAEVEIRRQAEKADVLPTAIDDIVMKGSGLFTVDSDGQIIQRDSEGKIIETDGKATTVDVWLDSVKVSSPHFWPGSKGRS